MLLAWVVIVCILIYLSFVGWGQLIVNNEEDTDFAMAAAYGMAGACVIGGILNWFHLISPHSIQIFLAVGILSWVVRVAKKHKKIRCSARIAFALFGQNKGAAIIFGILLLITFAHGSLPLQNAQDDNHAYLVFPHQMLETGHIGDDPFNERRLGVFGGQSFLNAMILTFVSHKQVRAFDAVAGWLVFIMLVMVHGYRHKLPYLSLLLLLSLWHWAIPPPVNISSQMTAAALFYAFLCRFQEPGLHVSIKEIIKTAILVAALCSLKATNIAGLAFLGTFVFLLDRRIRFTEGLQQGIKVAAAGLILVSPWMFAMHQSSGTFFFPLLGHGTHTSWEQGAAILSIRMQDVNWAYLGSIILSPLLTPVLSSGILILLLRLLKYKEYLRDINPAAVSALLAAVLGSLCLSFMSLGIFRYSYALNFAAFIFLVTETLSNTSFHSQNSMEKQHRYWLVWLVIAFYMGATWPIGLDSLANKTAAISNFTADALRQFPRSIITTAQKSTPPGSSIMVALSHPYHMDFSRNQVFVIDHAGNAGPDQGLPVSGRAEELAAYLRKQKINYLIYSYADEGGYQFEKFKHRLHQYEVPYYDRIRVLAENNFKFRIQLVVLSKSYKLIHQDNYSIVIDLSAPEN